MNYIKHKRNHIDYCNICGEKKELTWDHVPPQSSLFQPDMLANTLFSTLPSEKEYMRHYQSGIKYRSICAKCNNMVLGNNDSEYKRFIKSVHNQLLEKLEISQGVIQSIDTIIVKTKINRLLRSICGHLLAMKDTYDNQVLSDVYMRNYVLNEQLIFDKEYFYVWIYPYATVVNARDFATRGFVNGTHPHGMVSIMSSHPLAFICSSEDESECGLDDLGKYTTSNIDDEVYVTLHFSTMFLSGLNQIKHFLWPFDVNNNTGGAMFAMTGKGSIEGSRVAIRKQK